VVADAVTFERSTETSDANEVLASPQPAPIPAPDMLDAHISESAIATDQATDRPFNLSVVIPALPAPMPAPPASPAAAKIVEFLIAIA
jgi:hypothetical protein